MAMPIEEPDIELGLEVTNQLRDGRLRDAETSCRSRKITGFKDRVYGTHARRRQSHFNSSLQRINSSGCSGMLQKEMLGSE